jgi:hypothetical protein
MIATRAFAGTQIKLSLNLHSEASQVKWIFFIVKEREREMAVGMASIEAIAASPASPGVRPSSNKVLFVSSSGRWWMPIRWEAKTSSSWSRARARSSVMRALFSPVAMEWQECTYVSSIFDLIWFSHPQMSSVSLGPRNLFEIATPSSLSGTCA